MNYQELRDKTKDKTFSSIYKYLNESLKPNDARELLRDKFDREIKRGELYERLAIQILIDAKKERENNGQAF